MGEIGKRRRERLQELQAEITKINGQKRPEVSQPEIVPDSSSNGSIDAPHSGHSDHSVELQNLMDQLESPPASFNPFLTTQDTQDQYGSNAVNCDISFPDLTTPEVGVASTLNFNFDSFLSSLSAPPSPPEHLENTLLNHFVQQWEDRGGEYGDLSAKLQDHQVSTFSFPDDHLLEVPSLTLLNGVLKVALRLNLADRLWDVSSISPFYVCEINSFSSLPTTPSATASSSSDGSGSSWDISNDGHHVTDSTGRYEDCSYPQLDLSTIPPHLQPTQTQRLIPHHPVLDLLPWPNTRDKLIQVFSFPFDLRPPAARDALGLLRLIYDMEDPGGEGLSLRGQDPFEPRVWEIGQVLFERWWWAFETKIVEESNRKRKERGKEVLSLSAIS